LLLDERCKLLSRSAAGLDRSKHRQGNGAVGLHLDSRLPEISLSEHFDLNHVAGAEDIGLRLRRTGRLRGGGRARRDQGPAKREQQITGKLLHTSPQETRISFG